MGEEYIDIIGYEGLYKVSKLGNVINSKGKTLQSGINNNGYMFVTLFKNSKGKKHFIHRLLAIHFIPNPDNKDFVDHIDTNRLNNDISNLRWVTRKENANNPLTVQHNVENHANLRGINNNRSIEVIAFDKDGNVLASFINQSEAARMLNLSQANINRSLKDGGTCGGYFWKYRSEWQEEISEEEYENKIKSLIDSCIYWEAYEDEPILFAKAFKELLNFAPEDKRTIDYCAYLIKSKKTILNEIYSKLKVNEDELDKMATLSYKNAFLEECSEAEVYRRGFKAGYKKAIEK